MRLLFIIGSTIGFLPTVAQNNIPTGTWRAHFSYNKVVRVAQADNRIYAAGENGLFYFDAADNSVGVISKFDGLQPGSTSALAYDEQHDQLLIGYTSGNMDIIRGSEIIGFDFVTNSQVITSQRINHIHLTSNTAFIATDYGLLNFSLTDLRLRETYRELGASGEQIRINESATLGDSLYLATEKGVIASNINSDINLFDPANWHRYTTKDGIEAVDIAHITPFNDKIIAAINESGIFEYDNNRWRLLNTLKLKPYRSLAAGENLTIVAGDTIYVMDKNYETNTIDTERTGTINQAIIIGSVLWIADDSRGLVTNKSGTFESIKPSGPFSNRVQRFVYSHNKLLALPGGYDQPGQPLGNSDGYFEFSDGLWDNFNTTEDNFPAFDDITDAATFDRGRQKYFSSYGAGGILRINDDGSTVQYHADNSTLLPDEEGNYQITAIEASDEGLWAIAYNSARPLHLLSDRWQSFPLPGRHLIDMVNTPRYLWIIVDADHGGGIIVYDKTESQSRYLTTRDGNGGLPSNKINALAADRDGLVWVGTDEGVAYFPDFAGISAETINAVIPIFEGAPLLSDEIITAIEVDPGNRKWIGTRNGVWLFDETADRQLAFFDSDNSPLTERSIIDMEIIAPTGEIFFTTSEEILSYRADTSTPALAHNDVKIFPNPVTAGYNGTIGISGLVFNASVKITDAAGQLIWDTQSAGGTATWNGRDYNGKRAATGIYFVFSASQDGEETFIGKIAVID